MQHKNLKDFYLEIWQERKHKSEISGRYLGKELFTYFFHHILPKSKYPEAAFDKENIILVTMEEHAKLENDMYFFEIVNNKRLYLLSKYNKL